MAKVNVTRKVGQTKFRKPGLDGLITLHDGGLIAASLAHKNLLHGTSAIYDKTSHGNYLVIKQPTSKEYGLVFSQLFS